MKKSITIRIDEDVLEWFRSSGVGYQSRMNDALRNHIDSLSSKKDLSKGPVEMVAFTTDVPPKKSDPAGAKQDFVYLDGPHEVEPAKQDVIDSLKEKVALIPGKKSDPYFRPMEKKGSKKGGKK